MKIAEVCCKSVGTICSRLTLDSPVCFHILYSSLSIYYSSRGDVKKHSQNRDCKCETGCCWNLRFFKRFGVFVMFFISLSVYDTNHAYIYMHGLFLQMCFYICHCVMCVCVCLCEYMPMSLSMNERSRREAGDF